MVVFYFQDFKSFSKGNGQNVKRLGYIFRLGEKGGEVREGKVRGKEEMATDAMEWKR